MKGHPTTGTKILVLATTLTSVWSFTAFAQNVAPVPATFAVSHLDSARSSFTFTWSDLNGATSIRSANVILRSVANPALSCTLTVDGRSDQLTLSEGTLTLGSVKPGKNGSVTGSLCSVDGLSYNLTKNPVMFVVSLIISFQAAITNDKTVLMQATDATGVSSPQMQMGATGTYSAGSVTVSPSAVMLTAAQNQQFTASVTGAFNTAVTWTASAGTVSTSGLYTAPASIAAQTTATVTATSVADPTKKASATVTLMPPVVVSLTPRTATLRPSQTQQFTASVTGTTNTGVTWTASAGTVSASGLYTAPASIATQTTATVTATSVADSTKKATATLTLMPPVVVSMTPATATLRQGQTQQFTASVTGTLDIGVKWTASAGTVSASGLYTAPASITAQAAATVTATSVLDPTKKATATVTLMPPVVVSVAPGTSTLRQSQTQQFTASVTGTTTTGVTWTASAGTVSASGLYTAPASIAAQTTATVTATSAADTTRKATATVTLMPSSIISGAVTPLSLGVGTIISLSGATTAQATADSSGNYSFAGLANGTYTVTPTKPGVVITPATQTLTLSGTNATVNFAAVTQAWSISGVVYGSPATLTLSGTAAGATATDSTGKYNFSGLSNGSYVVAPSQSGYTFTPSTALVNVNSVSVSGVNFTAQATPKSVTLSWTASTSLNVTGYNVYRATRTGGPYAKVNSSQVSSLAYVDSSVSSGQSYFYVATAVDGSGNESTYSSEAAAIVPAS